MWMARVLLAFSMTAVVPHPVYAGGPTPVLARPFVIVLDAGHGGDNHGCLAFDGHTSEKSVTMELARATQRALVQELPHAHVHLTREDDAALTLAGRIERANAIGADLFISLHANASPDHEQHGFETYVLDATASARDAAWTARRENEGALREAAGAPKADHEAATMVRELERAAQRERSVRFAAELQRQQAQRFPERADRGVRQAPFDVLMGARMPAVLFEAGFLDHPQEGARLLDPEVRSEIAAGIAQAVVGHYRGHGS